jgi:hypothetical protein
MMSSRGMGAINPKKMPGKKVIHRKDKPQDVDMYAEGGKVNAAGKKAGKQFVKQPPKVTKKTAGFR